MWHLLHASSHEGSLHIGHHLYVDIIHRLRIQAVQFHTPEHAARWKWRFYCTIKKPPRRSLLRLITFSCWKRFQSSRSAAPWCFHMPFLRTDTQEKKPRQSNVYMLDLSHFGRTRRMWKITLNSRFVRPAAIRNTRDDYYTATIQGRNGNQNLWKFKVYMDLNGVKRGKNWV